jgi:hypothetical protein
LRKNFQEPFSTTAKELANEALQVTISLEDWVSNKTVHLINDCTMLKSKCLYLPYTLKNLDGHETGTMGSALAVYAFYAADGWGFTTLPLYMARERMLA